jgi:hypothetical protein
MPKVLPQKTLIALLVLISLASSLQILLGTRARWQAQAGAPEPVSEWDARLARLRAAIPIQNGTVGYIGDWDLRTMDPDSGPYADQETEYILTQYSLAPLVLKRGADFEWVVANLTPSAYKTWRASLAGELRAFEFGWNFHLIHRLSR